MQRNPTTNRNGASRSLWMATADPPVFAPLSADAHARVCVVGAGIAGLTTAYLLAHRPSRWSCSTTTRPAGGETARTTGAPERRARRPLLRASSDLHGEARRRGSRRRATSRRSTRSRRIVPRRGHRLRLRARRRLPVRSRRATARRACWTRELDAARRAGLVDVERLLARRSGAFERFGDAPALPAPGAVPPARIPGGPRARSGAPGRAHPHADARRFGRRRRRRRRRDHASGPRVHGRAVVVATNTPVNDRVAIHTKQAAYRTYVIGAARAPRRRARRAATGTRSTPTTTCALAPRRRERPT